MKHRILFALIMGVITTGLISFTVLSVNVGYKPGFIALWLRSWALGYLVVIPIILFIAPQVQRLVNFICSEPNKQ